MISVYMENEKGEFIEQRRREWKKSVTRKLNQSRDIHEALSAILNEYIYYAKNRYDLKKRILKIPGFILGQLGSIGHTRKEFVKDALKLEKIFKALRQKLRRF